MDITVEPSQIRGAVYAPPSKSMTQRAIGAALLAGGQSTLMNPSYCDDSIAALGIAENLGARVEQSGGELKITGSRKIKETTLNCHESGLAIRMFSPIAALYPDEIKMTGSDTLKKRPMTMIADALSQLGVTCTTEHGFLPVTIHGPMNNGRCVIDGSLSSQLLTGLLMALPLTGGESEIEVINLKSKPYIDMTIQVLEEFGIHVRNDNYTRFNIPGNQEYNARSYTIEGDWSGGAFLLVAGAINGNIRVKGLQPDSKQSDAGITDALEMAGASMKIDSEMIEVSKSELKSFNFDATESPDLFPPLVALASYCNGISRIKGVSRLLHKESDRSAALMKEFGKMGIKVDIRDDEMTVTGGKISGVIIDPHGDHRIAMAAAVAALGASGKVIIQDSQCVAKSYPGFFDDLRILRARIYE